MRTVIITEKMKEHAYKAAKKIQNSQVVMEFANYTGLVADNRYFAGFLGEFVFGALLKNHHRKFSYKPDKVPGPDGGDFLLYFEDGPEKLADVKTATKPSHTKIMFPMRQAARYQYDIYVGVRLNGDVGEIWGFCGFDDFHVEPNGFNDSHVPTLYRELSELTDIDELIFDMEKDEQDPV